MSTSHDRRVVAYLRPSNKEFVTKFAEANSLSNTSKAINIIVEKFRQQEKAQKSQGTDSKK